MKKTILSLIACSAFASLFISSVNAQEFTTANIARNDNSGSYAFTESASNTAFASKAYSKASKNFSKLFKNTPQAEWYLTQDDGFAAVYTDKGSPSRALFAKNGQFLYSITRHSADRLPGSLVKEVKNAFDGYKVICGEEIWVDGKNIFLVHIQSYTKSRTIRVADGDMEIIEELVRL